MIQSAQLTPPAQMTQAALKFESGPIHPNDEGNMLLTFRERGFAVVEDVFQRDSVDAFREQLLASVKKTDDFMRPYYIPNDSPLFVHPAKAPRLRHMLRSAFAWGKQRPQICLGHPDWLVKPSNPDAKQVHDWHKDGDHESFGSLNGYQYPSVIHANMYFEDMTIPRGPTFVIPRSHRETISPYSGEPEEPLLCRKGDVVLWDQRMWHRGSARTAPGLRVVAIFGFYSIPRFDIEGLYRPCESQKRAWREADDPAEKILFGGPFDMS